MTEETVRHLPWMALLSGFWDTWACDSQVCLEKGRLFMMFISRDTESTLVCCPEREYIDVMFLLVFAHQRPVILKLPIYVVSVDFSHGMYGGSLSFPRSGPLVPLTVLVLAITHWLRLAILRHPPIHPNQVATGWRDWISCHHCGIDASRSVSIMQYPVGLCRSPCRNRRYCRNYCRSTA